MSSFQINVITKTTLDDENFICPNCLTGFPFDGEAERISKPMRFGGSTASCFDCGEAYLALDEGSVPQHLLQEIKNKEPIIIFSDTGFIEQLMKS